MYKLLLILRYLRRKLAPMFAALAVTLCTAMVIIVISVMGGFLEMWRDSAKKLSGEITISAGLVGFGHYDDMLAALRNHPDVQSATAIIYTFGIVKIDNNVLKMEVVGIRPDELDEVVQYRESLHWTPERIDRDVQKNSPDPNEPKLWPAEKGETIGHYREFKGEDLIGAAMRLEPPKQWRTDLPAMVTGIAVYPGPRDKEGDFSLYANATMGNEMTVTVVPMTEGGQLILQQAVKTFVVVNELKSGFIEFDANRVYVPFDTLQQMLQMQSFPITDENNVPVPGQMSPAKTTAILVKSKPGVPLAQLKASVAAAIKPIVKRIPQQVRIQTWEEQHATILGAVEKEKFLLVFLFAIISLVAFVMVATTFYNIVLEKTRDVGVLRALGASHLGVAGLFLGYGLAIGVVGSLAGFLLAWGVVANLNGIQDFLEKDLGAAVYVLFYAVGGLVLGLITFLVLGRIGGKALLRWRLRIAAITVFVNIVIGWIVLHSVPLLYDEVQRRFGIKIWDAQIYYFDRIPAKLDWTEVIVILIAAVMSAVLGSLIPAIVASRLDPVEAIRYE